MENTTNLFHRWIAAASVAVLTGGTAIASGHWLLAPLGYLGVTIFILAMTRRIGQTMPRNDG